MIGLQLVGYNTFDSVTICCRILNGIYKNYFGVFVGYRSVVLNMRVDRIITSSV